MGRKPLIWIALGLTLSAPIVAAAFSPLLAWRSPIYILAGFAGILAMACLLLQPLLAGRLLPNISPITARRSHHIIGGWLILFIVIHVVGLWLTSAPDVIDAFLFRSPTPFSAWGVVAMWAVFATAFLAIFRRKLRVQTWRILHGGFAFVIAIGSAVHAFLIQGTMEPISKAFLCIVVLGVTAKVLLDLWLKIKRAG